MDALLVIDVQCGMFADPAALPHEGEAVVARIAGMIDAARAASVPVIFVQHDGGAGDVLASGEPGFLLRPELTPRPDEPVIVKRFCSAFQDTELADLLPGKRITVCGMATDYCVDTTCRSAFERGYDVILAGDAHTTLDSGVLKGADIIRHHNAVLANGGFVTVRPAAECFT